MTWLFSKALCESLHCSQAPEAESLEATCSDGEPFAQLNVMPTPHKFSRNDKTMDACHLSRFGLTLRLLTESHGEELLTLFLAGFPVRTLVRPEKAPGSKESEAGFGLSSHGSLAKYNPDLCSWKTRQFSLLGGLEEFSETWPRWGSMRNGECWERPTLELPTSASEHGLWPTPTAMNATGGAALCKWGGSGARAKLKEMVSPEELNGPLNPEWVAWLMGWPTGWTSLKPLEMGRFQEWQQQHSICLPIDQGDNGEAA
jgi:hypothetical protein